MQSTFLKVYLIFFSFFLSSASAGEICFEHNYPELGKRFFLEVQEEFIAHYKLENLRTGEVKLISEYGGSCSAKDLADGPHVFIHERVREGSSSFTTRQIYSFDVRTEELTSLSARFGRKVFMNFLTGALEGKKVLYEVATQSRANNYRFETYAANLSTGHVVRLFDEAWQSSGLQSFFSESGKLMLALMEDSKGFSYYNLVDLETNKVVRSRAKASRYPTAFWRGEDAYINAYEKVTESFWVEEGTFVSRFSYSQGGFQEERLLDDSIYFGFGCEFQSHLSPENCYGISLLSQNWGIKKCSGIDGKNFLFKRIDPDNGISMWSFNLDGTQTQLKNPGKKWLRRDDYEGLCDE